MGLGSGSVSSGHLEVTSGNSSFQVRGSYTQCKAFSLIAEPGDSSKPDIWLWVLKVPGS